MYPKKPGIMIKATYFYVCTGKDSKKFSMVFLFETVVFHKHTVLFEYLKKAAVKCFL